MIKYVPNPCFPNKFLKEATKQNKGYCMSARHHTKEWKCICQWLKDAPLDSWCPEGLFQKVEVEDE
jgi:hypothetical protein